ncbi:hypothetical protein FGG08_006166 [Glutinoglossum americanum]|uniref:Xaa-Pro aminopeptidase n=1 Tax=Glutinoglossum americanum TaxID=1670608 RepID=A0A9P8HT54_9PEZI|nr:hypothetical protein FGG08_006166 [Glutinoglossum americanum]
MTSVNSIIAEKYPAKAHAERVAAYIKAKEPNADGVIYLEGQKTSMIEDCDEAQPFSIPTGKLILYIPPIDADEVIWTGLPLSLEEALKKYDVDEARYSTDVNGSLAGLAKEPGCSKIWAIHPQISEHVTFLEFRDKDYSLLKEAIEECRVVKDVYEIGLIRKANEISAGAHHAVMRAVKEAKNEQELEAVFLHHCISHGSHKQAYHSIVASGTNAATLHYQKNDEPLSGRLNLLLDAGCEYACYASDITRTFPLSGHFTPPSLAIYNLVLLMQKTCTAALKADVLWEEIHVLAHKVAITGLLEIGVLAGGTAEQILEQRTSVAFFPHGLGHYLGLDTHDSGGHPRYGDEDSMFRYLRVRGKVPAGSVVTVEPGIYFCDFIISPYLGDPAHSKFIDKDVLAKYWEVGGVRIEDNILITPDGYENLTTVVKEVSEMERLINGS